MRVLLVCYLVVSIGCSQQAGTNEQVRISTMIADGDVRHDTTTVVESDYFEMSISSITDRTGRKKYTATKDLESPTAAGAGFHMKTQTVVDSNDSTVYFTTPEDWLNYMSERGYEMVSKTDKRYGAEYTFKKKSD
ncbi:MAG TPA: hypothetical protein VK658_28290 [Chryseolinea sp.]|nr:hypothetical protein [Chryseolinea sp.]